jgi:Protein of unknown function (DUF3500)
MAEFNDRKTADSDCSFCSGVSRRDFVRTVGAGALAAAVPLIGRTAAAAGQIKAGPTPAAPAETAVARFYKTITPEQRKLICFPFDNPLRKRVANNWDIVKPAISDMTTEQQALCREIMKNLCSEDGYERFMKQMDDDNGGFESYHVAVFGEPGTDKPFEWVLTGRHDTLRADGNSVQGAAFGGPIFYGHAADGHANEDAKHTNNVWWYQAEQANKVFRTLDDKQKAQSLVAKAYADEPKTIQLRGAKLPDAGLRIGDLDSQQKAMVKDLVEAMLRPFRAFDAEEVRACLDNNGGVDALRLTFCKEGDIGNDGVWDNWKLEGPAFSWFFRGSPHVHTWLNVASTA